MTETTIRNGSLETKRPSSSVTDAESGRHHSHTRIVDYSSPSSISASIDELEREEYTYNDEHLEEDTNDVWEDMEKKDFYYGD